MKNLIFVFLLFCASFCEALERQVFYDREGKMAGSSVINGNRINFYDRYGKLSGSALTAGNKITYYDRYGKYQGQSKVGSPIIFRQ